jgi:hypothetical protein
MNKDKTTMKHLDVYGYYADYSYPAGKTRMMLRLTPLE